MIEIIEIKNVYADGSVRATVMSDTSAELNGVTSVDGTKLRFGSLAVVAKEDVVCKLASNGVWYKSGISLEDVTVTPSTSEQTVTAGEGFDGIGTVTVGAVSLENKTVTPSTSQQTITAGANYNGIGTVTVGAVTAAIDSDIAARNIKKDVTILGVTGTYEGSGGGDFASLIDRSIESVTIPTSITSIGNSAFAACTNFTSIEIPSNITSIGSGAFAGCTNLTSIEIPSSVLSIGATAFQMCSKLENVTISSGVASIGQQAFRMCSALESISIPSSVTEIGANAFAMCSNLQTITINKPEGSISGAPWGAPNATVTWTG